MSLRLTFPIFPTIAIGVFIVLPFSTQFKPPPERATDEVLTNEIRFAVNDEEETKLKIGQGEVVIERNLFYVNLWLQEGDYDRLTFIVREEELAEGVYVLDDVHDRFLSFSNRMKGCTFRSDGYYSGILMINNFDSIQHTIEGSFEFIAYSNECDQLIRLRDGQFKTEFNPSL